MRCKQIQFRYRFHFVLSFLFSLPLLSHAWDTTVSFTLYVEYLPAGRYGVPLTEISSYDYTPRFHYQAFNLPSGYTRIISGRATNYAWQVYPPPNIEPGLRHYPAPQAFFFPRYLAVGQCTDLPPATCCRSLSPVVSRGQFSNLPRGAISAFWGPVVRLFEMPPEACERRVLESRYDAPQWAWQDNGAYTPRITGASYILCPSSAMDRGWGAVLAGFCARAKMKRRRGTGGDAAASLAATPPTHPLSSGPAWVWPDVITMDGVNYTDGRKGNLLYYDSENRLLNFTGSM